MNDRQRTALDVFRQPAKKIADPGEKPTPPTNRLAFLSRWRHSLRRQPAHDGTAAAPARPNDSPRPIDVGERLEYAFRRLHQEFGERERYLHARLHELERHQQQILAFRRPRARWTGPLVVVGALAIGYTLYLLTAMQQSITTMANDVTTMNGHMDGMAEDTAAMSQNIGTMNRSIGRMSTDMGQMNRNVGVISQATVPMGQAAQTMSPFMQTFRSFMPF